MKATCEKSAFVRLPISLPRRLAEQVDQQAIKEGLLRGRSTIIRRSIMEYMKQHSVSEQTEEKAA